jgi:hypothetical protein
VAVVTIETASSRGESIESGKKHTSRYTKGPKG